MALDAKEVSKPQHKLRKLLKKMSDQPTPDEVHKFRTNSRRFEAIMHALSLDVKGKGKRTLKLISRMRKRAGKVRDMDVLTGYVSSLSIDDAERDCSVRLLEHLGAQRQKHAARFHALQREYGQDLRKLLKRTSGALEKIAPPNRQDEADETAKSNLGASALRLLSDLDQPPRLGKNNLHPYRLKVKELRNLLQLGENSEQQDFVEALGDVKDTIGEWHDWQELVDIAKDVLDHDANCGLLRELMVTTESKYRVALSAAESMRKEFLHKSSRKGPNRQASGPAEPVWSATSAIAA